MGLEYFILPIILILYGEFSNLLNTRFIARIIFYTYTLAIVFPLYIGNNLVAIVAGCIIIISGFSLAILHSDNILSKTCFILAPIAAILVYTDLRFQGANIFSSIPYLRSYGDNIFRVLLVIGISTLGYQSRERLKDWKLESTLLFLGIAEVVV